MFIDIAKHMLESDNRFIMDGEEITNDELQNAKEYIFNFQDLLKVINKNYQDTVIKILSLLTEKFNKTKIFSYY